MAYLREKHAQQQQRGGKGSSGGAAQRPPKADVAKNDKVSIQGMAHALACCPAHLRVR